MLVISMALSFCALNSQAADAGQDWDHLFKRANNAAEKNDFETAAKLYWDATVTAEGFGFTDRRYKESLEKLGWISMEVHDFRKAQTAYGRLAWVEGKRVDTNAWEVGEALLGMAQADINLQDFDEGEKAIDRAQPILEQKFGAHSGAEGNCLNCRAQLAAHQGQLAQAEQFYEKAIAITDAEPRPAVRMNTPQSALYFAQPWQQPQVASLLNDVSLVYREEGKFDKAEAAVRRAVTLLEWQYGKESASLPTPLLNLAVVCLAENKLTEAEAAAKRALRILKSKAPSHPMVATAQQLVATIMDRERKGGDAGATTPSQ